MPGDKRRGRGHIRIIGGSLRGRRIPVPDKPGLRPTPDRVRETLFNWLRPSLPGSRCLDLFAGAGALALEAVSQGAEKVVAVEQEGALSHQLHHLAQDWGITRLRAVHAEARRWLQGSPEPFDVVFLDPPFDSGLIEPCLEALAARGWLAPGALVYVERPPGHPALAARFDRYRESRAGQVAYGLYRRAGG